MQTIDELRVKYIGEPVNLLKPEVGVSLKVGIWRSMGSIIMLAAIVVFVVA